MSQPFDFSSLVELCRRTHNVMQVQAGRSVDMALVVRNWLFGRYIVEFEQNGADRAEYGAQLIERLASGLRIKGTSATNLRKFRQFYREYPIQQAVSVELGAVPNGAWLGGKCVLRNGQCLLHLHRQEPPTRRLGPI